MTIQSRKGWVVVTLSHLTWLLYSSSPPLLCGGGWLRPTAVRSVAGSCCWLSTKPGPGNQLRHALCSGPAPNPFFFLVSLGDESQLENEDERRDGVRSFDAHENPMHMADDDDYAGAAVSADIETAPLMSGRSNVEMVPAKLIVVRSPDALKLAVKHINI